MAQRERLATLISGGGTTMQEIIKSTRSGEVPIDIACVIASKPSAGGIEKARKLGIPESDIIVISPNDFRRADGEVDQDEFGYAMLEKTQSRDATIVTQNGYLPLTPGVFIDAYPGRIFNQHPGPLPDFGGEWMYGRRVHAVRLIFTRLTKRDKWTEAVAHRVTRELDAGAVVGSARVDILPEDTVDDLNREYCLLSIKLQIDLLKDIVGDRVTEQPEKLF